MSRGRGLPRRWAVGLQLSERAAARGGTTELQRRWSMEKLQCNGHGAARRRRRCSATAMVLRAVGGATMQHDGERRSCNAMGAWCCAPAQELQRNTLVLLWRVVGGCQGCYGESSGGRCCIGASPEAIGAAMKHHRATGVVLEHRPDHRVPRSAAMELRRVPIGVALELCHATRCFHGASMEE